MKFPAVDLGGLHIDPPLLMAPMAGVTDSPFRRILRSLEPGGLLFTEMLSAEGLSRRQPRTYKLLLVRPEEQPVAFQLFGPRAAAMARSAAMLEDLGAPLIDLNMGCPARKVVRSGSGCALLDDPSRALSIVRAVVRAVSVPVTVKIRKGRPGREERTLDLARAFEAEGVAAITVHGRGPAHSYAEPADWSFVQQVATTLSIPVIGNGDIDSPEAAARRLTASGCAAVMVGRAILGDPWLFQRIAAHLAGREAPQRPDRRERAETMLQHLRLQIDAMGPHGVRHFRMLLAPYVRGMPGAAAFRRRAYRLERPEEVESLVRSFLG